MTHFALLTPSYPDSAVLRPCRESDQMSRATEGACFNFWTPCTSMNRPYVASVHNIFSWNRTFSLSLPPRRKLYQPLTTCGFSKFIIRGFVLLALLFCLCFLLIGVGNEKIGMGQEKGLTEPQSWARQHVIALSFPDKIPGVQKLM